MPSLFFWKEWPAPWRRIWIPLAAIFILAAAFMWHSSFRGNRGIIHWEKIQEQRTIETTVHSFRLGPFELHIPGESYVIFEYLQGSDLEHNTTASFIFLFLMLASAMVLLTLITTLEKFWYFSGMSVFILFMVSLRLDVLMLFGQKGILIPAVVLLAFVAVSFYFKSIRPHTSLAIRLIAFLLMAVALAAVIHFFGKIPFPLLYLAMAAYTPGIVLSILFIFMVAHEIMASFVFITSQGSKSLRHFLIISTIYLVNVFITCLHELGTIDWDFIYINLYLLLTLSAILGLWGFRQREELYENIFSFSPYGAFFFIALGTICFGTLGQLLGNANDAALKVIRDLIIFSHTAFGIAFLLYIFSNYMVMMAGNFPVHRVLYRPTRMPYFTFRLAGVIITLAFVFTSYWQDYVYHSMAGFYNYAADLYRRQGNETFARAFYDRSRVNAFQNHRANYALGMIKAARIDFEGAFESFGLANGRNPSDFSLVNQGNLHLWRREYFPAIEVFHEAQKVKESPALSNNLAFAYARVHNLDSAIHYIAEARQDGLTKASAETNFFALTASELLPVKTDSILTAFDRSPGVLGNAIAMATLFDQKLDIDADPLAVRNLDLYTATLLNNYIIRNARTLDTAFTSKALRLAEDDANAVFREAIKASLAYAYYHQGNVYKAQQIFAELVFVTQTHQGKYNYVMGLWALEQGNPEVAATYFGYALRAGYKRASLYNAIALTEAQQVADALVAWDSVAASEDLDERRLAEEIKRILTVGRVEAMALNDREKYQYARYTVAASDTAYFARLLGSFEDPNYKAQMLLDMCRRLMRADRLPDAMRCYNNLAQLEFTDENLFHQAKNLQLLLLASENEAGELGKQLQGNIVFDPARPMEKVLYTALISQAKQDTAAAKMNFSILGTWNPYFEEGILAAASYYRQEDPASPEAYDILAEAIQLNPNSIRLLKAYAAEAERQGLFDYAGNAAERIRALENR